MLRTIASRSRANFNQSTSDILMYIHRFFIKVGFKSDFEIGKVKNKLVRAI